MSAGSRVRRTSGRAEDVRPRAITVITGIDRPTSGGALVGGTAAHTPGEGKMAEWRGRAKHLLEQADKLPSALSGGQQQRVAGARALANDVVTHDRDLSRRVTRTFTLADGESAHQAKSGRGPHPRGTPR